MEIKKKNKEIPNPKEGRKKEKIEQRTYRMKTK